MVEPNYRRLEPYCTQASDSVSKIFNRKLFARINSKLVLAQKIYNFYFLNIKKKLIDELI